VRFDMTDIGVRRALFHFHNRCHRGEVWLWVRHLGRTFPVEQSQCPKDAEVFGEIESKIVGDWFVDQIVPLRQRTRAEIERMRLQTEEHRRYRAECWRRYSIVDRITDMKKAGERKRKRS
jgi:hypothetical protein